MPPVPSVRVYARTNVCDTWYIVRVFRFDTIADLHTDTSLHAHCKLWSWISTTRASSAVTLEYMAEIHKSVKQDELDLKSRKVFESISERLAVAMETLKLEVDELQTVYSDGKDTQMHKEFLRRTR